MLTRTTTMAAGHRTHHRYAATCITWQAQRQVCLPSRGLHTHARARAVYKGFGAPCNSPFPVSSPLYLDTQGTPSGPMPDISRKNSIVTTISGIDTVSVCSSKQALPGIRSSAAGISAHNSSAMFQMGGSRLTGLTRSLRTQRSIPNLPHRSGFEQHHQLDHCAYCRIKLLVCTACMRTYIQPKQTVATEEHA